MTGEPRRHSTGGTVPSAKLGEDRPLQGGSCWLRWSLNPQTALTNLTTLLRIARLPASLITSRSHDVLLTDYRMRFLSARLGVMLMFLGIATIAWIPIDAILFEANWDIVLPLAAGRMVAALAFFAIGSAQVRADCAKQGIAALGLAVVVGIIFFSYTHVIIGHASPSVVDSAGHAQFMLMPIALAVGISIFPLTLLEALALTALPLFAFLIETLFLDGSQLWLFPGMAALLMCLIMITTATSAMSQLALLRELHEQSTIDSLTGAISRRAGMELLKIMFERSRRSNAPLSLVLFDLDRFKSVNDRYGHEAGDQLLREVTAGLKERLRRQDALIRWGGEEFVLVLADTRASDAARLVVKLCRFSLGGRPDQSVQTVSAGLAERQVDGARNWQELIEIADQRMYAAKERGRNRLHAAGGVSLPLARTTEQTAEAPALQPPLPSEPSVSALW